jgi:hypothetical protein
MHGTTNPKLLSTHSTLFDHSNNIWWRAQFTTILNTTISPSTYLFYLLAPNIFLITLFLKYLQHMVFPKHHHHHHHHRHRHHHHIQEGLGLIPVPCILKMKLVPPSLPRSSYLSSSFWFIL